MPGSTAIPELSHLQPATASSSVYKYDKFRTSPPSLLQPTTSHFFFCTTRASSAQALTGIARPLPKRNHFSNLQHQTIPIASGDDLPRRRHGRKRRASQRAFKIVVRSSNSMFFANTFTRNPELISVRSLQQDFCQTSHRDFYHYPLHAHDLHPFRHLQLTPHLRTRTEETSDMTQR